MRRRPALLIPLVLLVATACVSVRDGGRPARTPPSTAAAPTPPSAAPPRHTPAREALVRTDDGTPRGRGHTEPVAPWHAAKPPVHPPRAATPPPRYPAGRPVPAAPRRTAAPVLRAKRPRPGPPANHDMRVLCRSAARNGVGPHIVALCRAAYG
ncbi:hypothetical protein [Streptomyces sp. HF10]|uniref:hypothetical protein n=1 Tax=Streptomyces sp. HF10 TaxID=2692233 RepID=UPI001319574C|nr:hypothetical protein [Streptomyces sp. HF10]QHC33859.1 hypothetical protein GR129_34700 [Streptomyces sp. HF10]